MLSVIPGSISPSHLHRSCEDKKQKNKKEMGEEAESVDLAFMEELTTVIGGASGSHESHLNELRRNETTLGATFSESPNLKWSDASLRRPVFACFKEVDKR